MTSLRESMPRYCFLCTLVVLMTVFVEQRQVCEHHVRQTRCPRVNLCPYFCTLMRPNGMFLQVRARVL